MAEPRMEEPRMEEPDANEDEIFDADFLRRLRTLFFSLRKRRQLRQKGSQQTHSIGHTREFKDHRPYTSRDDFRAIDWRLFARLEKLFIRIFEEVQEFHVQILIDRSRSMIEPYAGKRATALRLAVALAYLALMNQHRVSLSSFSSDLTLEIPPCKGQGHIHGILQALTAVKFSGTTDIRGSLGRFRPGRDRRGIVFLLSDLLGDDQSESIEALEQAARWPTETHVVHILDPLEMAPQFEGELQLVDVENGERRRLSLSRRDLERYKSAFDDYRERLHRICIERNIDYLEWTTDRSFESMFLGLLSRGSALARG